jgi:hypothetical protein
MVIDPVQGLWRERVDRLSRYSLFGLEAGATVLLREFGWCRIGLTGRAGWHELAGASEQGEESGPFRNFWWSRKLSGSAPGVMAGVEWEWFPSRSVPLSGFLLLGYRMLVISDVSFNYIDSNGLIGSGSLRNADGTRAVYDCRGPEFRFGIQWSFFVAPSAFEVPPE